MNSISRVGEREKDSYLLWSEKLAEKAADNTKAQKTDKTEQDDARNIPARRTRDEYIPGTDRLPDDRKTPEHDKISEGVRIPDTKNPSGTNKASKQADDRKPEICKCSTDKVDREIEKLKKRKEKLEGQLRTEKDEQKIQHLERELAQVERELTRKDNDTYRRQHMEITKQFS